MDDTITLAHGIGGAKDLPIPTELAISGAVAALTISFLVLAIAWRRPRYDAATRGVPVAAAVPLLTWLTMAARIVGLLLFGYTIWVAVWGQDILINPFFGMFYVLLWVGLVPASVLLGPVWRAMNPLRSIALGLARLARSDPQRGLYVYPERLGYWPAAAGLFAFVWLELIATSSTELATVRLWFAGYVVVMLLGGLIFGARWFERADAFEVFSTLAAKLSVWHVRDGRLLVRSPLANLDTTDVGPGLVGVVAILFGSTAFDSFKDALPWVRFVQRHADSSYLLQNVALVAFCVTVGLLLTLGTVVARPGPEVDVRGLPDYFAPSVVPIIVGYVVAHYLTYLSEVGQQTMILMSDPMSDGSNYLGTADLTINYWLSNHPSFLAVTKVVAVVIGHVLGVIAAHERAVKILPLRSQLTGQLPMLVVMVCFTVGGLYLLFAA